LCSTFRSQCRLQLLPDYLLPPVGGTARRNQHVQPDHLREGAGEPSTCDGPFAPASSLGRTI
jgi:hypothetical protein